MTGEPGATCCVNLRGREGGPAKEKPPCGGFLIVA
jgi:hypothetical protein